MRRAGIAVALGLALMPRVAGAHKPSDAHLQIAINGERLTGSLAVAVRDLDGALDLDFDGNGQITWAEATAAAPRIAAYAGEHLAIAGDDAPCTIAFGAATLVDFSDGAYWTLPLTGTCAGAPATLTVAYKLLFEIDAQHRGIVQVQSPSVSKTAVARDATPIVVELEPTAIRTFVRRGFERVAGSLEHVAFLACLVLPIVLRRRGETATRRDVATRTASLFGMFALANLVMLLVSAAGLLQIPAIMIGLGVGLSIVAVAVMNLARAIEARWDVAFELGLLHGLGFAIWLHDLGAPAHRLAPVLGFAVGVIAAQGLVVAAGVIGLYAIRRTVGYRALVWVGSSAAVLAGIWWAIASVT